MFSLKGFWKIVIKTTNHITTCSFIDAHGLNIQRGGYLMFSLIFRLWCLKTISRGLNLSVLIAFVLTKKLIIVLEGSDVIPLTLLSSPIFVHICVVLSWLPFCLYWEIILWRFEKTLLSDCLPLIVFFHLKCHFRYL